MQNFLQKHTAGMKNKDLFSQVVLHCVCNEKLINIDHDVGLT